MELWMFGCQIYGMDHCTKELSRVDDYMKYAQRGMKLMDDQLKRFVTPDEACRVEGLVNDYRLRDATKGIFM